MKNLQIFSLITALFLSLPQFVSAHTLKTDGSIGAILHVNPEDDPIVGKQSSFFFEIKDKDNVFQPKDCECTFSILQNGKVLYTQPLFQNNENPSLSDASAAYYFADKGVYTIRLAGQPRTAESFAPFTLDYDLRVSRTADSQPTAETGSNWFIDHIPHLIGGTVGFSVLGYIMFKGNRKKEKSE